MSWLMAVGRRTALTKAAGKTAVAAALVSMGAVAGPAVAAYAARTPIPLDPPTGPNDPRCIQMPLDPVCQGGPYYQGAPPAPQLPTNPLDPACAGAPGNAACVGSPFLPPPPPVDAPPPPVDAPPPPVAPPPPPPVAPPPVAPPPMAPPPMAPPPMAPPPMVDTSPDMGGVPGHI